MSDSGSGQEQSLLVSTDVNMLVREQKEVAWSRIFVRRGTERCLNETRFSISANVVGFPQFMPSACQVANMTTLTLWIICGCVIYMFQVDAAYLPKRGPAPFNTKERILDPKKRPFCNAFTGCGRKRSNLPALSDQGEEIDESIGSLLELSAEPAVEDLSRQIMSEAKLWEAIQEANVELNRRKQGLSDIPEDDAVPARSATASCALPPCYI